MNRTQAESFIAEHVKPIFGFALKRCARIQDAEDVAQEIALRAYQALLTRDDVTDPVRYIWTVAHHVLANHYRHRSRTHIGLPDSVPAETDFDAALMQAEAVSQLRQEIACLGRIQREIVVAYYFHGRKQADIAAQMGLPLGTVKWHLFEAKKELKRNMEKTRSINNLMFDPIRFAAFGTEGSIGEEGSPWRLFRSVLNQNIAYAAWHNARTVAEIAEALGVSPVYVEDAVDYMAEQGYLTEENGKYRCALLLTEADTHLTNLSDLMYQEAAGLIAPALHKALMESDVWSSGGLYIPEGSTSQDRSFALWALIPWCIANSQPDKEISFDDVATLRPDGARNIVYATISTSGACTPALYDQMDGQFSGPCWNEHSGITLWQLDTCWSERRIGEVYHHEVQADLSLLQRLFASEGLSAEEYARLAQKGLIRATGSPDGLFKATLTAVWLRGKPVQEKLLALTQQVYAAHADALSALKQPYADALMADTPSPLHKLRRFMLQNVFQSDWFIMHCLTHLVKTGVLQLPAEEDRRALHTLILTE